MSVEESVDYSCKKNILFVKEVEIITGLDLVEIVTLESRMPIQSNRQDFRLLIDISFHRLDCFDLYRLDCIDRYSSICFDIFRFLCLLHLQYNILCFQLIQKNLL